MRPRSPPIGRPRALTQPCENLFRWLRLLGDDERLAPLEFLRRAGLVQAHSLVIARRSGTALGFNYSEMGARAHRRKNNFEGTGAPANSHTLIGVTDAAVMKAVEAGCECAIEMLAALRMLPATIETITSGRFKASECSWLVEKQPHPAAPVPEPMEIAVDRILNRAEKTGTKVAAPQTSRRRRHPTVAIRAPGGGSLVAPGAPLVAPATTAPLSGTQHHLQLTLLLLLNLRRARLATSCAQSSTATTTLTTRRLTALRSRLSGAPKFIG